MLTKIDLSGNWGLRLDKEKLGQDRKFYMSTPDDQINLPSTTSLSKKGTPNTEQEVWFLTDEYAFEGWAWYYKTVTLADEVIGKITELFLERTRQTTIWVNGKCAGSCNSLCTPHRYDISDYIAPGENQICIMVSNTDYPTKGGHMTSPDTQSNWNGITGELSLRVSDQVRIESMQAYPAEDFSAFRVKVQLVGTDQAEVKLWGAASDGTVIDEQTFCISPGNDTAVLKLGKSFPKWSHNSPVTCTIYGCISGKSDRIFINTGLRTFTENGREFLINGKSVKLRGKHDGMLFPLTGAAPTTVEEWHEYLLTVKSWGFNHLRFHTCCPPDAAFTAADLLGIFMQPELPFWGTIYAPNEEGYNADEQEFLIEEGRRILREFGNHPSFVMMSLGNELWGSKEIMSRILAEYKEIDTSRLYTQGSNNFQFYPCLLPEDDFFSGVRLGHQRLIRGSYAACDKPFGFVQTNAPNTAIDYDGIIRSAASEDDGSSEDEIEIQFGTGVKKVKAASGEEHFVPDKPIVTHEIGQYCSYPDYAEIPKYTGALKPRNLEVFRQRLAEKGMLSQAEDFHKASGMLAFQCYKLELEAAMRSQYIAGFQLLDLQDFTGQGTALVGMLNSLMLEKSVTSAYGLRRKWLGFCSDAVILAELDRFVFDEGDVVNVPVRLVWDKAYTPEPLSIFWSVGAQSGTITVNGEIQPNSIIGEIKFTAPADGFFELTLKCDNVPDCENSYLLRSFRRSERKLPEVLITSDLSEAERRLGEGEPVIYIPKNLPESVRGEYCTDFWCYPMFRSISESMGREVPTGTLGLLIQSEHPALRGFESRFYTTPQWHSIVSNADCAVLDGTPEGFRPIVQMIDNFERNHKLGLIYEANAAGGRLLVCTSRLMDILDKTEARALLQSLAEYAVSGDFTPEFTLTLKDLGLS